MDAQLAHAIAHRLNVAKQAALQAQNTVGDPLRRRLVGQPVKPVFEGGGLTNFLSMMSCWR
jgi:hypothetical protein